MRKDGTNQTGIAARLANMEADLNNLETRLDNKEDPILIVSQSKLWFIVGLATVIGAVLALTVADHAGRSA